MTMSSYNEFGAQERVSDEWLAHEIEEVIYPSDVKSALQELQMRRMVDRAHSVDAEATQEREKTVLPIPCTNVKEATAKEWFAKINEELDELKAAVLRECTVRNRLEDVIDGVDDDTDTDIAEEASDTITAITSMLEAMGIDEQMRQEAQRRVNERNAQRKDCR